MPERETKDPTKDLSDAPMEQEKPDPEDEEKRVEMDGYTGELPIKNPEQNLPLKEDKS